MVGTSDRGERQRLVAILSASPHSIIEAASGNAVATAISGQQVDVAIVDTNALPHLRRATPRIFLIALTTSTPTPSEFWSAYAAGADDVLRFGAWKEEVLGRVGGLERVRSWSTAAPNTLTTRICRVPVLSDIESIVATGLGELLGATLHPTASPPSPLTSGLVHTSVIPLTLVSDHILLRLGLGVDATNRDRLAVALLGGDTTRDAVSDALREMANTAGGAIRRAALDQGVTFTVGLPSNENLFARGPGKRRAWIVSDDASISVECIAAMSANDPRSLQAKELREGMVLARDVVNPMGVLIAPAGTYLTRTTAEQIARLVGPQSSIEISDDHQVQAS